MKFVTKMSPLLNLNIIFKARIPSCIKGKNQGCSYWSSIEKNDLIQFSIEGRTQEALISLFEVDQDISKTLEKIVQENSDLLEVIRGSVEAVTSVLLQGFTENDSSNGNGVPNRSNFNITLGIFAK